MGGERGILGGIEWERCRYIKIGDLHMEKFLGSLGCIS